MYICSFFACKILLCGALSIDAIYGSFLFSPFSTFRSYRSPVSGFLEYGINFCGTFVFPPCFLAWWINVDGLVMLTSRDVPLFSLSLFLRHKLNCVRLSCSFLESFPFLCIFLFVKGQEIRFTRIIRCSADIRVSSSLIWELVDLFHELLCGYYATGSSAVFEVNFCFMFSVIPPLVLKFYVCSNNATRSEVLCYQ